ncbi:P-loop containing nucleoside triphosphate hydrolase protein [Leptodontidium sp. MPI-SDFR-AT-0119]|nr:P-loop containing nucleoside triphosphate hydrolase protein [Leptodontidium sp. MPI-SDFR-AT-0119]
MLSGLVGFREHVGLACRTQLVGHSLGGLVIQQALVIAIHQQQFTDVQLSVAGIIFLGAPFQGSDVASIGTWLAQISGLDSTILKLLEKESPSLYALSRDFWGSYGDWDLVCYYEKNKAKYGPVKKQMVNSQSASLLGKRMMFLDADHSGLNKFGGEDDDNFKLVLPEIRRMVKDGPSIVAERYHTGTANLGNVHWIVPRTVSTLFTGRGELLLRIQEAIQYSTSSFDQQKRFIITGLGGQGKSEICLQVANQMRDQFWGVFWVDVDKKSTAESDFVAIAKRMGHSVESLHDALHVLANTKKAWLLILDNADDPDFNYQVYFPSGNHGAVLMTSRVAQCKQYSPDAFEALGGLGEEDSKNLLFKAAEVPLVSWSSQDDQAKEVVNLLGSHTLALIQAGAYVSQGHCQLHQYPKVYQRQRQRLLKYRPKQAYSRYRDMYATFEASADVLEQSQSKSASDALRLLEILSMLGSNVLPLQIFEEGWKSCKETLRANSVKARGIDKFSPDHVSQLPSFMIPEDDAWDPFRLTEASSLLVSLSLVTRHNLNNCLGLSMHPLTHAWAKDRQDSERQGMAWIAAGCVLGFSCSNTRMWQTYERRLLPHVMSYLDIKVKRAFELASKAVVTSIFLKCSRALLDMRQDTKLGQLLEDIFLELGQNPDEPSEEFLPLYNLQGRSLRYLGKNKEAVALLEQVVKICETTQPETHPDRLTSQHELAIAYQANGQVVKAVALLEQVVKIRETTQPETHPNRLNSQHELATAYRANGQVIEAVVLLEQVVKIRETTQPETHPDRLNSQHELATAYRANGQVIEAVALLEQVVKIKRLTLAISHPSRVVSENALSYFLQLL